MPLPTAAQVRSLALRSVTGTGEDTRISSLVTTADELLARTCLYPQASDGQPPTFASQAYTLLVDAPSRLDPRRLDLRLRPITLVSSVSVDEAGDWTYATSIASTEYVVSRGGHLRLKPTSTYSWLTGSRPNRVVCTAGFDVSASPTLTLAIALQVAYWWQYGFVPSQVQSLSQGGQSVTRQPVDTGIPPAVRALIEPLRLQEREGLAGLP